MSRHSKNSTATHHFTYHERQAAGHGTLKRRFGKDAQLPFGFCCLCLQRTEDRTPLASPSGYVFCKECIYANLLAQKRTIQENVDAYERFCEKQEQDAQDAIVDKERGEIRKFLDASHGASLSGIVPAKKDEETTRIQRKMQEKVDRTTDDTKREAMKRTSFWIPDVTPQAQAKMDAPDTKTRDPMSQEEMKLKHLMPLKFTWSADETTGEKHVVCAVSKKAITHQMAVLLRPSGQVLIESCVKDMVLPSMTCPISGLKLRKKDIIKLQTGGTSYSAHSNVEAKKYRPSMT
jgi:nitric oxide synthase-interacting protein